MSQRGRSRPGARRPRTEGAASARRPGRARPTGSTAPAEHGSDNAGARPARREDPVHSSPRRGRARPARVGAPRDARRPRTERTVLGLSTGRAVVLALVVCGLALTLAVPLRTYVSQRSEADQLAQQREQLETEIAALEEQKALMADPAWVRTQARERLRFVMPGDIPYQVQLPGDAPAEDERTEPEMPTTGAWYSDLWLSVSVPAPEPEPEPVPQQMPVAPAEPGDIPG